jgi:hypothetical protein
MNRLPRRPGLVLLATVASVAIASACTLDTLAPAVTPTVAPASTPIGAPPPVATAVPTPPPAPILELTPGSSIVVGGEVFVRPEPATFNRPIGRLSDGYPVQVLGSVEGENWLLGKQTWVSSTPAWTSEWLQVEGGGFVYGGFVFTLRPGETSPLIDPGDQEKWVDVNISEQTATAMVGDQAVHAAPVTTGLPGFETPKGTHAIEPDGRVVIETMTASQAGYSPEQARYEVERVLFTQYFDREGNALHLNYWRPDSVFGAERTSHGCAGMQLHDAQYFWLFAEAGTRVEIHD